MQTIDRWMDLDRESAATKLDRDAIDATASLRESIVRLASLDPEARDLLHACAMLGRLLAASHASPALAAATIDDLARTLGRAMPTARAAVFEAYVAEREERALRASAERWSYPSCAVHLDARSCAVACLPDDDVDALAHWADGVARALARLAVRDVIASGPERARKALEDACALVGIRVQREIVVR